MAWVEGHRRNGWVLAASLGCVSPIACGVNPPGFGDDRPGDAGVPALGEVEAAAPAPLHVILDPSFAAEGALSGDLADWNPTGIGIDPKGRIVVSGPGSDPDTPLAEVVRRLTPDGALDPSFGTLGKVTLAVNPETWGQAVRVLPSGGIGILGAAGIGGAGGALAVRLNADGSPDSTFAGPLLTVAATGAFSDGLWQDDGSAFIFGSTASARFDPAGATDSSYGTGGLLPPAVAGAVNGDGRLWTVASSRVSRFLASGAPDPSFGQGGTFDLPGGDAGGEAPTLQCVLLDASDRAVVIGSHPSGASFDIDVIRFTASGAIDPSFGASGLASMPAVGGPVGAAELLDGRILVWTSYGELLAISPDGEPAGTFELDVSGTLMAAALDAAQRLVVVGMDTSYPPRMAWFVRRYQLM
jgi:uncharacterized delta-60 repeat protein